MVRSSKAVLAVAFVLLLATLLGACSQAAPPASPPAGSPVATRTVASGLAEWGDGRVEAAGYVVWVDLEGGFWALNDRLSQSPTDRPRVVAVLLPGEVGEKEIAAFEGGFVVVSGTMQGGASIRMAGPEIVVDDIALALPGAAR